ARDLDTSSTQLCKGEKTACRFDLRQISSVREMIEERHSFERVNVVHSVLPIGSSIIARCGSFLLFAYNRS
ncbi:hypothetical protein FP2506_00565, partial [Fulvimarina pelagi HTCC2506]